MDEEVKNDSMPSENEAAWAVLILGGINIVVNTLLIYFYFQWIPFLPDITPETAILVEFLLTHVVLNTAVYMKHHDKKLDISSLTLSGERQARQLLLEISILIFGAIVHYLL